MTGSEVVMSRAECPGNHGKMQGSTMAVRAGRRKRVSGFTLVELLVAFALMLIMISVIYTVFSAAGNAFDQSAARLEIFETASNAFRVMRRDFRGAIVDGDGRIFRGYAYAYSGSGWYGGKLSARLPALSQPWRTECMVEWDSHCRRYNYLNSYTSCVWFRTTTAPEGRGKTAEVIYRVRRPQVVGTALPSAGVLERGVRTGWGSTEYDESVICKFPGTDDEPDFVISPLAMKVYDLRFYYLNSVYQSTAHPVVGEPNRWASDGDISVFRTRGMMSIWPPYRGNTAVLPKGAGNNVGSGGDRDNIYAADKRWSQKSTAEQREALRLLRRRLPAAVLMMVRMGDYQEREWTDRQVSEMGVNRERDGNKDFDEIGMWFEQIFFVPNHVLTP